MTAKQPQEPDQDAGVFRRVVGYFLDHEKPKEQPKRKRRTLRKKPSTKAKKRA